MRRFWLLAASSFDSGILAGIGFFAVCGLFFVLLAVNHAAFVFVETPREDQGWIYLLRLAGFVVLLAAIVIKTCRLDLIDADERRGKY